jgi:diguanylate cyclase (GGDEF)-like protein
MAGGSAGPEEIALMDNLADTWVGAPPGPLPAPRPDALLVHIHPTGRGMGSYRALAGAPLKIGRGEECDLCIPDGLASRCHACVVPGEGGYDVVDLGSTNGTWVNDTRVSCCRLQNGDYLRIGGHIFHFLAGDNAEAAYHEEVYRLIIVDALTEIPNKRYLLDFLERELARTARYRRPLSLVLFDVDRFKAVNDRLGHLAGDCVLRELARCARQAVRREELLARYGGEEFAVVLPETEWQGAVVMAERLRIAVQEHPFLFDDQALSVTISVGVAVTHGENLLTPADLIRQADERLYQAKREGRNRVAA